MANRSVYQLNPQGLGQPRGIGISVLYNNGNNIFHQTTTTADQIKANLINYVLTNKGERLQDPNFGGDIRRSIFEQNDYTTFDTVSARLESEILAYIPGIILNSIDIQTNPDENLVNIAINYSINQQNQNLVISVSTNNLNT
jgi:phage baseplate assembly protein W